MDELGPEDRAVIDEAVAARSPSAADRARVRQKLIAAGALGGMTGAATGAAQASGALSATKVVSILALVGVTGGAIVWWSVATPTASTPPTASAAQTEPEAPPLEEPATEAPPVAEPVTEATIAPEIAEAAEHEDAPPSLARRRRASPPRATSLRDDVALLHRAQAERARDPAHALELALEHGRRFPRSPLTEERTALRVLLLCDLGRRAAAERLGDRFLARTEDSPLRRSVEESCVQR